jgi:hypothetical protein
MTDSRDAPPQFEAAATSIIRTIRGQVDDLRALVLGLGSVILLLWIAGVFAGLRFEARFCCGRGIVTILDFSGTGILSTLVTTALLVSSVGIWTARSRETRTLREEWNALSIDSGSVLSVHLVERAGVWRDAIRRNLEAAFLCAVLLPLMVFLLVLSIAVGSPAVSPAMAWVITIAPTLGCGTFAFFQVGGMLLSGRRARSEIDRQRRAVLESMGGPSGVGVTSQSRPVEDSTASGRPGEQLVAVEEALLGREREAARTAARELHIAGLVIAAAAVALVAMAAGSASSLTYPGGSSNSLNDAPYGDAETGVILALIGFVGILWAGALFRRDRAAQSGQLLGRSATSPAGLAVARIDDASGQLDRARATAGRGRNVVVLAAVLVLVRLWFVPGYYSFPAEPLGAVNVLLSVLALPLALLVVVWTAFRLDRIEDLEMELRQWVRAFARLEQAFWDRF